VSAARNTIDTRRAERERAKSKRVKNYQHSVALLRERGVSFTLHNNGWQLVIRRGLRVWEFWPSTGSYVERSNELSPARIAAYPQRLSKGRGVFNLLKALEGSPQ
jgi:hypothetical protein